MVEIIISIVVLGIVSGAVFYQIKGVDVEAIMHERTQIIKSINAARIAFKMADPLAQEKWEQAATNGSGVGVLSGVDVLRLLLPYGDIDPRALEGVENFNSYVITGDRDLRDFWSVNGGYIWESTTQNNPQAPSDGTIRTNIISTTYLDKPILLQCTVQKGDMTYFQVSY